MVFWTNKKKPVVEIRTPEDLQRHYSFQIEQFFNNFDISSPIHIWTSDAVEKFLEWAGETYRAKRRAERDLNQQRKAYGELSEEYEKLKKSLAEREKELGDTQMLLHQESTENEQWQRKYNGDMRAAESRRQQHLQEAERRRQQQQQDAERETTRLIEMHSGEISEMQAKHTAEKDRLLGQLLTHSDETAEWPDDKLKMQFERLRTLVDSITSPQRNEFLLTSSSKELVGVNLDPTRFLSRGGYPHLLLKNALWSILFEQFFSAVFGFGALGPDKGLTELLRMYGSWRRLFDPSVSASPDISILKTFESDRFANKWRTSTFHAINQIKMNDSSSPLGAMRKANVDRARQRIVKYLSEFARVCGRNVSEGVQTETNQLVELANEMGLQFGVQSAQLRVLLPKQGEIITIGQDYHDTQDGEDAKGQQFKVDLATAAGLQKVGDGRSDMTSKRAICPSQVWTDQP